MLALQRADTPQREALERCYGTGSEPDAITVREVYDKLNLAKTFRYSLEELIRSNVVATILGRNSIGCRLGAFRPTKSTKSDMEY